MNEEIGQRCVTIERNSEAATGFMNSLLTLADSTDCAELLLVVDLGQRVFRQLC